MPRVADEYRKLLSRAGHNWWRLFCWDTNWVCSKEGDKNTSRSRKCRKSNGKHNNIDHASVLIVGVYQKKVNLANLLIAVVNWKKMDDMGQALDDTDGFVKFLVDKKSRNILGCHILGNQASILIHEVLVAMKADGNRVGHTGGTINNVTKTVHIHPAL
ncbi:MAG: hypothetical protein M3P08_13035 [Thermoproteota archaeon]|nr:hypothetical protein [Thermoproteota archaeon]